MVTRLYKRGTTTEPGTSSHIRDLSFDMGDDPAISSSGNEDTDFQTTARWRMVLDNEVTGNLPTSIHATDMAGNNQFRWRVNRLDSGGAILASSDWSGTQTSTGVHTHTFANPADGQEWAMIELEFQSRRDGGMPSNNSVTLAVSDPDAYVDAELADHDPVTEAPTLSLDGDVGARSVPLAWTTVDNANSYEAWDDLSDTLLHTFGDVTSGTVTGLSPETDYDLKVRGVNAEYDGPFSNIVQVTTPEATDTFWTDFSDTDVGQLPSYVTVRNQDAGDTIEVVDSGPGTLTGGKALLLDTTGQSDTVYRLLTFALTDDEDTEDVEFVCRVAYDDTNQMTIHNFLRSDANPDNGSYLAVQYHNDQWSVDTWPAFDEVATTPFASAVNTFFWVRVRVEGDTFSVKAWADGVEEPEAWGDTGTDTLYASGFYGIGGRRDRPHWFDVVGIGIDGATAPTTGEPAVPPPDVPTGLAVTEDGGVVTASWSGDADSYNLRRQTWQGEGAPDA